MSFSDGLYRVQFGTSSDAGTGVAYLSDGKLHGGDTIMSYVGTYTVEGDQLRARARISQHSQQPFMSPLLGLANNDMELAGTVGQDGAHLSGTSPQAPGVTVAVQLQRIA